MNKENLPVIIIGAGPVGLAAAAHLVERNRDFLIIEAGEMVGHQVSQWRHVRMFSPWKFNIDGAAKRLLEKSGWQSPAEDELPTGEDIVMHYLIPLAQLPDIAPHLRLNTRIVAIGREGFDKMKSPGRDEAPFVLKALLKGKNGESEVVFRASAVIDASGTWGNPNPIGAGGLKAIGEAELAGRIFYGIPDVLSQERARYTGKRVAVIGAGHSAVNALLDLAALRDEAPDTRAIWVLRGNVPEPSYGGGVNDALPARGQLGLRLKKLVLEKKIELISSFRLQEIQSANGRLELVGEKNGESSIIDSVDEIIATTGARPDSTMFGELRVALDPAVESVAELAPLIDPNIHSCGTVPPHGEKELRQPEKDFYIVGMKSYGRAPTFLLATGYEQVRSVVAALDGDWEAASKVQLQLPQTGVCSSDSSAKKEVADESCCDTSCCTDEAEVSSEECCDKEAIPAGAAGTEIDRGCC